LKTETQIREDHQAEIIAEMEPELLEKYRRQAARKIAQKARIPGFRPGKAPFDVVRRMYGDDTLNQEAIELLTDDLYGSILDEAGVEPSGPGTLKEILSLDPVKLSFIVPLKPQVELNAYRDIRQEYTAPVLDEAEVDEFLTRLRRGQSSAEPVERAAQNGDQVYLQLSAHLTTPVEGEPSEIIAATHHDLVIGEEAEEGREPWPFPGFGEHLIGLAAGQEHTFTYLYPEESPYDKLRGKEAEFHVTVESVKELKLPELNDEFAQSLGSFENVEALRQRVHEQLDAQHKSEYEDQYYEELMDKIVAQATIKYPPHMLQEEIESVAQSVEQNLGRRGLDLETYLKLIKTTREEFIEKEIKPQAEKRLVRTLVMDKVVEVEEIEVKEEDVRAAFNETFMEMGNSVDLTKFKTKASQQQLASAVAMQAASRVMNQRTLERLKAIATGQPESSETAEPTAAETAEEPASEA